MAIKSLTVENAQIKTASVEVKTLTISGKQVTLAVFRQMPGEEYPAATPDPRWPIWGWINYHTSNCSHQNHRHIVWQKGNELRKSSIVGIHVTPSMWNYCTQDIDQLFIAV